MHSEKVPQARGAGKAQKNRGVKMPIIKYTTSIDAKKTLGEIQGILVSHGATAILTEYDGGNPSALCFKLGTSRGELGFRLPINARAILIILERDLVPQKYKTHDQAVRVGWRIIKDWVASQTALVETEMVSMEEVFMPYLLMDSGKTLFEKWKSGAKLLGHGEES